MPGGDRTGPRGQGPMTGRGAGYCNGVSVPGFASAVYGQGGFRGAGIMHGRGRGRGFRNRFFATGQTGWNSMPNVGPISQEALAEMLRSQAMILQENLNALNKRIENLKTSEPGAGES